MLGGYFERALYLNMTYYLYGLYSSERPEIIRYIGYTSSPKQRLSDHIKDINRTRVKTFKKNWISKVLKNGHEVKMIVLFETQDIFEAKALEIKEIRERSNLVNGTSGGDGVTITPEVREKMRKWKRKPFSEETIEKMRLSRLGKKPSDETKKKMSDSQKRIGNKPKITPETILKIKIALTGRPSLRKGIPHTEEAKLKISNTKKGRPSHRRRPIIQIDPTSKLIVGDFASISEAVFITGINNICRSLTNPKKLAGNYEWKYKT